MSRHLAYFISIVLTLTALVLAMRDPHWWWSVILPAAFTLLGTFDVLQRKSTLRRNYPILAHFRYGLETIGPEIRQYFIQADTEQAPFSREQRALIYQRAKHANDVRPFGTLRDVYAE
ncbi:MAG TPA: FMN-binding glutamate synthase family protein, partial [Pseudomonadales bacterium]|nr:FMN-binding glutamate synthase family protein [Pseudomonadales bacterium]